MAEALKPGDQVAFLNYEGGGKVIALLDDDNLMIELDEGFEIPVNRNEVVKERDFTSPGRSFSGI
jgi:preprotein translocase subunit YajC